MSHFMPPQLLALFAPRQPIPFKQPLEKRGNRPLEGIAQVELDRMNVLRQQRESHSTLTAFCFPYSFVINPPVRCDIHSPVSHPAAARV